VRHSRHGKIAVLVAAVLVVGLGHHAFAQRWLHGIIWPEPPVVTPGGPDSAPSDAIVLFDGKNFDAWKGADKLKVDADGAFTARAAIQTKQEFGDCQLHLEFASPKEVKGSGQGRGNNGIGFLGARYEIQVLDSFNNKTYFEGQCASVYNQTPPMVNASRKPGEWQTFDIVFSAPRFATDGADRVVAKPAYFTVFHNGVLVHNHTEVKGLTYYDRENLYTKHPDKGPLVLMYHGDPVRFRNIWVREFKQLEGKAGGKKGKE
jgi:3-keto-disaccharide hydrolase